MHMYFIFSEKLTLLFDFWTVETLGGLVLSFLVVLLLTVLYEVSKVWKSNILTRVLLTLPVDTPDHSQAVSETFDPENNLADNTEPMLRPDTTSERQIMTPDSLTVGFSAPVYRWWLLHTSLAFLHTAQVTLGYMIMLCVMSYNAAIFLSVLLGSGLGYFLAFPLLAKYPKPHSL
ncbi:probable low affinity copper uptake protein 2 [Bombina bombina]|uniref:probable low affinity copper uptake protein 2 n=1 Tax=Bombina bombina TaxID=8345 RepID=UPI00235A7FB2|nr:probable low affinity copper uptake protein 2 [Bombina bombina]